MKILTFLLVVIYATILSSCNNSTKEYYSDGSIRKEYTLKNNKLDGEYVVYFANGDKKVTHIFSNGFKIDSSVYYQDRIIYKIEYHTNVKDSIFTKRFYKNNAIKEEGASKKNIKVGKWKYYREDGTLNKIFEYINLNGIQYTNQGWHYDNKGVLIKDFGNYFSYQILDKEVKANKLFRIKFHYKPILALNSNVIACLSTKVSPDFKNLNTIKLDTTYFATTTTGYQDFILLKRGREHIRGYIKEFLRPKNDPEREDARCVYFDIPIDVK